MVLRNFSSEQRVPLKNCAAGKKSSEAYIRKPLFRIPSNDSLIQHNKQYHRKVLLSIAFISVVTFTESKLRTTVMSSFEYLNESQNRQFKKHGKNMHVISDELWRKINKSLTGLD